MPADGFTTVHVTTDPVEGEMLVEALRGEAIDARLVQVNAALLGAAPSLFQRRIEVPADLAARARELLDELGQPGQVEAHSRVEEDPEPPRRSRLKAGVGLIVPGAAHYYARHPWTAITLEAGFLACIIVLWFGLGSDLVSNIAFSTVFAIVAVDVLGALGALRTLDRGQAPPSDGRQMLRGLALFMLAGLAGAGAALLITLPEWRRARDLATFVATCTDREISIRNGGARDRYVSLDEVLITAPRRTPDQFDRAPVTSSGDVRVEAGASVVRAFQPDEWTVRRCEGSTGGRPETCGVYFQLTLQEVDPDHPRAYHARGMCAPAWFAAHPPAIAVLGVLPDGP